MCMNEDNWILVVFVFLCLGCMNLRTSMNCEFVNTYEVAFCVTSLYTKGLYEQLVCKDGQM